MSAAVHRAVGFLGLGLMGQPMAANLLRAGLRVVGFDTQQPVLAEMASQGMQVAESAEAVVAAAPLIILMLPDSPTVEAVVNSSMGSLKEGSVIVDMGTTSVSLTRQLAGAVAERGAAFVDAPVSGGQVGAREGTLSVMVGAPEATFEAIKPVLLAMGSNVTRVGDVGAGQVAKACNQLIVGNTIAAVAEALALAEAAGVDPALVRQALGGGFAASRILEVHGQRMIDRNFVPGGRCTTQRKDMAQTLQLAESVGVELPLTAAVKAMYDTLIAAGLGDLDHSALFKLISERERS
eukprot:EG_transcript_19566